MMDGSEGIVALLSQRRALPGILQTWQKLTTFESLECMCVEAADVGAIGWTAKVAKLSKTRPRASISL